MTPHTIRLLGKPEITVEAQPLSFRTRKVLALFVYLLVEGGTHSREALMSLLWPEKTMQKASIALRVTLSRLRQALQPAGEALIAEGGEVGIDFHCPVDLDLNWLAAAVLPDTAPGELAAIREFDRGEFLAGFSLADAPEFDAWAAPDPIPAGQLSERSGHRNGRALAGPRPAERSCLSSSNGRPGPGRGSPRCAENL